MGQLSEMLVEIDERETICANSYILDFVQVLLEGSEDKIKKKSLPRHLVDNSYLPTARDCMLKS